MKKVKRIKTIIDYNIENLPEFKMSESLVVVSIPFCFHFKCDCAGKSKSNSNVYFCTSDVYCGYRKIMRALVNSDEHIKYLEILKINKKN